MEDYVIYLRNGEEQPVSTIILSLIVAMNRLEIHAINAGNDFNSPFLRAVQRAREIIYAYVDGGFAETEIDTVMTALEAVSDLYQRHVSSERQN